MGEPAIKENQDSENLPATLEEGGEVVGRNLTDEEQSEFFGVVLDRSDMGNKGGLRHTVLSLVLAEKYDQAVSQLREFLASDSPFPDYHRRLKPFVNFCIDVVFAIRAKRNFPGLNSLTRAKQQELREKFKEHFVELRQALKKIEGILGDLRIGDSRTTIYVVWTFWYSSISLFIVALMVAFFREGYIKAALHLINGWIDDIL